MFGRLKHRKPPARSQMKIIRAERDSRARIRRRTERIFDGQSARLFLLPCRVESDTKCLLGVRFIGQGQLPRRHFVPVHFHANVICAENLLVGESRTSTNFKSLLPEFSRVYSARNRKDELFGEGSFCSGRTNCTASDWLLI